MAHSAWMPLYWGDYFGDTTFLTCEEHGAYLQLIGAYWQRGRALPDDDKFLSAATKLSRKKWKMVRPKISQFFSISEGSWTHKRVEIELLKSCGRIKSATHAASIRHMPSTSTPTKEVSNKLSFNGNGMGNGLGKKNGLGNGHVTIRDPDERLNRFRKWLAERISGGQGWLIVSAASDVDNPDHEASLAFCKAEARRLGKGWPRQWA